MQETKKIQTMSLKVFALVCSFFLWLYVLSSALTKVEKKVEIDFILPEGYSILNNAENEITYTIEGPQAIVRNYLNTHSSVKINIKNLFRPNKLEYEIPLSNLNENLPFGVKIIDMEPKFIKVNLDVTLEKQVPVLLQNFGEIPSDHKLIQSTLIPSSINIKGPQSIVSHIEQLKTELISFNNITQSDTKKVNLAPVDARVQLSQKMVDFQYEIQPTRANMLIKNVPISFLTTRIFNSVNSRFVNLMILAENGSEIEEKKKLIKVIAEIPNEAKGEVEVELKAQLPEGLHLLEIMPNKIKIFVSN